MHLRRYAEHLLTQALNNPSVTDPEAGFTVGNAMGRNKYIYALSDYGLVVSASSGEGGAWSGAVENLKKRWVPLFVWLSNEAPPANQRLHEMGALPLGEECLSGHASLHNLFAELLGAPVSALPPQADEAITDHSDSIATEKGFERASVNEQRVRETKSSSNQATLELMPADANGAAPAIDLFPIVWPHLEQALRTVQTERELAECCGIEPQQARAWLQRAVREGLAVKLTRPIRYVIASPENR